MKFKDIVKMKKTVIHTRNQSQANKLCGEANKLGLTWFEGERYANNTKWDILEDYTCYDFYNGLFGGLLQLYSIEGYKIIPFEDVEFEDNINPDHYKTKTFECIEVTQTMNFVTGNAFKYVYRAGAKGNAIEDLDKAIWYLNKAIELEYEYLMPDNKMSIATAAMLKEEVFYQEKILYLIYTGQYKEAIAQIELYKITASEGGC